MTVSRRLAPMIALALMLAPVSLEYAISGPAGTGITLAKLAYPPCGFAKPGRVCWGGTALVSSGRRHRWGR